MNSLVFEYDEEKSKLNKEKHGIDFFEAQNLWNDVFRVIIPAKTLDEDRCLLIAEYKTYIWSAVYTIREEKIRIISVRRARRNEKTIYQS